jgi:hypothetical protein
MKTEIKGTWIVIGIMCVLGATAYSQIPPPPPPGPPTQTPLDGGVIVLAVAGAAYGAKKVYNKKKAKR